MTLGTRENWRFFEDSLKAEARFFSSTADATLADVFEELADHRSQMVNQS